MAFSASTFKSNLSSAGGGARPSLYEVKINFSGGGTVGLTAAETILVKAAAMPASTIAPLAVNYAGRAYKWQGFRTYDNWSVTVINDESFSIRNKMMTWMRWLSGKIDGTRDTIYGQPASNGTWYDGDAQISQVGADGAQKKTYDMINLWPTELGEIAVDWSSDAMDEVAFWNDGWRKKYCYGFALCRRRGIL